MPQVVVTALVVNVVQRLMERLAAVALRKVDANASRVPAAVPLHAIVPTASAGKSKRQGGQELPSYPKITFSKVILSRKCKFSKVISCMNCHHLGLIGRNDVDLAATIRL